MPEQAGALARHRWNLERFGLTPGKLPARLANAATSPVLCVSIPKAGTHLLERALCLHPRLYRKILPTISLENIGRHGGLDALLVKLRPGQVVLSHLWFEPGHVGTIAARGARAVFLVRDPHAIVVSQVHYVTRTADHRHHSFFASLGDDQERLRVAIAGDREHDVPSIRARLDRFGGWLDSGFPVVRFEDLVGPAGGGDASRQLETVRALYERLGVAFDDALVRSVCDRLFSAESPTFRTGSIDRWRSSFDEELEALFQEVASDALARYGYAPAGDP